MSAVSGWLVVTAMVVVVLLADAWREQLAYERRDAGRTGRIPQQRSGS